jgi:hypothetical protein
MTYLGFNNVSHIRTTQIKDSINEIVDEYDKENKKHNLTSNI